MIRKKIHCIESAKKEFDDYTTDEVREMIGFYEPNEVDGKLKWEVILMEEGNFYSAETQIMAELLSNQEMIKAILIQNMNISEKVDCIYKKRCSTIGEKCERCKFNKDNKIDHFEEIIDINN